MRGTTAADQAEFQSMSRPGFTIPMIGAFPTCVLSKPTPGYAVDIPAHIDERADKPRLIRSQRVCSLLLVPRGRPIRSVCCVLICHKSHYYDLQVVAISGHKRVEHSSLDYSETARWIRVHSSGMVQPCRLHHTTKNM